MEEELIEEIFRRTKEEGFVEGTEQYEVCKRALKFRSFSYKRSEELESGATVDCSTLISQAYWEGALIGIPFVAENQRKAVSGKTIESQQEMIPADVLIKYRSLEDCPDKTFNHVGLYLGKDSRNEQWLIESVGGSGVRLSKVSVFNAQGGIKRFTLSTQPFTNTQTQEALALAPFVPKFGRLGVRQYRKLGNDRIAHRGVDIYVPAGTLVPATTTGTIVLVHELVEDADGVEITGEHFTVRYLMLDDIKVKTGESVQIGDMLGRVVVPQERSDIVYSSITENKSHLHLEVEITGVTNERLESEIVMDGKRYLNHLYLSKSGTLALPFRI
ncbi:MAG: hypothetical protein G01um101417_89 [Parcubacteria group bacterium Gr01-1014_17]|nr:MAG: hypothetical protein G01um101417_89 [Parcubacteria group bacterium Gr01-1014_17]